MITVDELERRKFELHAEREEYRSRIEQAKNWIHATFDRFENPNVNYSGGKDSLVLLHLTADCGYSPDVYHFDNGLLRVPGNTDFVEESVARIVPDADLILKSSAAANSSDMVVEEGHGYAGFWGWYSQLDLQ